MKRCIALLSIAVHLVATAGISIAADDKPKIISVRSDGTGDYTTVQSAVDAAPSHAIIRIGPGTFEGPVLLQKPITLEGAGAGATILTAPWFTIQECLVEGKGVPAEKLKRFKQLQKIAVDKEHGEGLTSAKLWRQYGPKPTITVEKARDVILKGFSTTMPGTVWKGGWQNFHMVLLTDAGVTIEDCAFVGSAVDGIEITGESNVRIQRSLVGGIRCTGIQVNSTPKSEIQIADCDIRGCGYAGIGIKGEGNITISDCRISDVEFHGIRYDDASPSITGNVLSRVTRGGIYVGGKTKGTITDNLFFDCGTGISDDLVANNTFVASQGRSPAWTYYTAISVGLTGKGVMRNNLISGYDHALVVFSNDLDSMNAQTERFTKNLCDTTKSQIVGEKVAPQQQGKRLPEKPEVHELRVPADNWVMPVKFKDREDGDYALSEQVEWPERDLGSRKHAPIKSPWPEQPAERAMLDQIQKVESAAN